MEVISPLGFHILLWSGFGVAIAILAVALIREWRKG